MGSNLVSSPKNIDDAVQQILKNEAAVYVSKTGSNSNTGLSRLRPKLTFAAAMATAIEFRIRLIQCLDDGVYSETLTLGSDDIRIEAPFATLTSANGTATLTMTDYETKSTFHKILNTGAGLGVSASSSETNQAILLADIITGGVTKTGSTIMMLISNSVSGTITDVSSKLRGKIGYTISGFTKDYAVSTATLTPAAGASNVCEVSIQLKNLDGDNVSISHVVDVYLSDSDTGDGLTATSASGTVQAKSANGTDLFVFSAKKHIRTKTTSDGLYVLKITDSAKTAFYVCVILPNGRVVISSQLITVNYG